MDHFDASHLDNLVPVFPLPDCVLFPGAVLPLHLFEPRYLSMTRDLLAQPPGRRLLAIALLTGDHEELYHTNLASVRPVVGLGEMVQHVDLPDGCYNVLVVGRARARIMFDDTSGEYRRAKLEPLATEPTDMLASVDEAVFEVRSLIAELADLGVCERELVDKVLKATPSSAALIDIGTYHLIGPQHTAVKQRILEESRLEVRAEILAIQLHRMLDAWRIKQVRMDVRPTGPFLPGLN